MGNSEKIRLVQSLLANAKEKIAELTDQADDLKESRNTESKSTAGDKHAVGRAMAQTELDTIEKRIAELKEQSNLIKHLPVESQKEVASGSLVRTSQGVYFLAIGIGKMESDGKTYFVISPAAPIGQAMLGKKKGENFQFQNKQITIEDLS